MQKVSRVVCPSGNFLKHLSCEMRISLPRSYDSRSRPPRRHRERIGERICHREIPFKKTRDIRRNARQVRRQLASFSFSVAIQSPPWVNVLLRDVSRVWVLPYCLGLKCVLFEGDSGRWIWFSGEVEVLKDVVVTSR